VTAARDEGQYADRAQLIGAMLPVLKAARRPLTPEWERFGLDREGWNDLGRMVDRLIRHTSFEHLERNELRSSLHDAAVQYRQTPVGERRPTREVAAEVLDAMAREPMHRRVYLGIAHLSLPHDTTVADVRFLDPSQDVALAEAFTRFGEVAPALVCEIDVVAGTAALLLDRARDRAAVALGLIRQQNLFGFPAKIYLDQVIYGLDGTWTWRDEETTARAGWWRHEPTPTPMDLSHPNSRDWRAHLAELSDLYEALPPPLRLRVDTCLDWLDVAALSDRWRIIIPAIFSAMEALLVPETLGLKAEVVTVRSVAVHVALEQGFFDPGKILQAYELRNNLIHGAPTDDVINAEAIEFAEDRRYWAFLVLKDYLKLAKAIEATTVRDLIAELDSDACVKVCEWLEEHGGSKVVGEYRKAVPASVTPG
jgi:hypothetical protein